MVDHSDLIVCVFDGKSGGTKNTIDYAVARGVTVVNAAKPFLPKNKSEDKSAVSDRDLS